VLDALLSKADVNIIGREGITAAHMAAMGDSSKLLKLLADHKVCYDCCVRVSTSFVPRGVFLMVNKAVFWNQQSMEICLCTCTVSLTSPSPT
jgi:hypothetical protein